MKTTKKSRESIRKVCEDRVEGPGKFEGCERHVAHYYDGMMEGFGEVIASHETSGENITRLEVSEEDVEGAIEAVNDVLEEVGCADRPLIPVLNKIDLVEDESKLVLLRKQLPECVMTSAANGQGLQALTERVSKFLDRLYEEMVVETDVGNGKLLSFLYESGAVLSRKYDHETVRLKVKIPDHLTGVVESMGGKLCARAQGSQG